MQRCLPLLLDWLRSFPSLYCWQVFQLSKCFPIVGEWRQLRKEGFFSCSFIKFVEGSYFIQFAYSISEYSYRGGVNHSFYVSVGGISSYDVLLSGEEIPLGDVCGLHVLVRSGLAFIGGTGGEKW